MATRHCAIAGSMIPEANKAVRVKYATTKLSVSLAVLTGGAVLLAAVGLYGMMVFFVSQHSKEIGIRIAIGASVKSVLSLVVTRDLKLTLIGGGIGLVGALGLSRLLKSLLFGIGSLDPVSFLFVPGLLLIVAGLATWLPARRAASIEPSSILRVE